jgi:flagellar M-ring protein FliF
MPNISALRETWRSLEPRGQLTLVVSALLVLVTMFLLYNYASKPSYTVLETGLDPAATAEVSAALDGAGVGYRIANGGTQVEVREGQESQARVALAETGVSSGSHDGYDLFDKQSLGATEFQQNVNYQRALEGEIATTIEEIDAVQSAQVRLVLPKETLFDDRSSQASAAVLLDGGMLDGGTVRGIAHLVSSSVQGLDAQRVTITDATGTMLWPTGDGAAGGVGANTKLAAEQAYNAGRSAEIEAALTRTLGPGKALVQVKADLNVDQTTLDTVTYGKKGTPLTEVTDQEQLRSNGGGGAGAGGPAGTPSNTPPYATQGATGGSESNYQKQHAETEYGVDKTVEHTVKAPGSIVRQDVAVIVDQAVPTEALAGIESTVAAMAGLQPDRGDTISVTSMKMAEPEAFQPPAAGPMGMGNPLDLARHAAVGIGLLAFLFLMRRSLRRREGESFAPEPTWLREIEEAMPLAQLEGAPTAQHRLGPGNPQGARMHEELGEIVKSRPDQLASQIAQWMND